MTGFAPVSLRSSERIVEEGACFISIVSTLSATTPPGVVAGVAGVGGAVEFCAVVVEETAVVGAEEVGEEELEKKTRIAAGPTCAAGVSVRVIVIETDGL